MWKQICLYTRMFIAALITNMKKGTMPSLDRVKLLADHLQCSISDLTGEAPAGDPELAAALSKFERLTPAQQAAVQGYMDFLLSQQK